MYQILRIKAYTYTGSYGDLRGSYTRFTVNQEETKIGRR